MIPVQNIQGYFLREFKPTRTSQDWFTFCCPFCNRIDGKQKMAVHYIFEHVKCWECGYGDNVIQFVADYEDIRYSQARRLLKESAPSVFEAHSLDALQHDTSRKLVESKVTLPHSYQPILEGSGIMGVRARAYLTNRGFDLKALDKLGVGYCNRSHDDAKQDYLGYIIVPFKRKGKLVYYLGRDFMGRDDKYRYKNPAFEDVGVGKGDVLLNEDSLYLFDEVCLLEGWADAYTIGKEALSSQGWSLSKTQLDLIINSPVDCICIIPDPGADEKGETFYKKALQMAFKLVDYKQVKVLDLNPFVSLYDQKPDVNVLGKDIINKLRKEAPLEDFSSLTTKLIDL